MTLAVAVPVDRDLNVDEVCWELQPLPEPAPMPASEMIVEVTIDALSFRLLAVEALDALRALTLQLDRAREDNRQLRNARAAEVRS